MADDNTFKDLKYANWNQAYADLVQEIAKIREVGAKLYFSPIGVNRRTNSR